MLKNVALVAKIGVDTGALENGGNPRYLLFQKIVWTAPHHTANEPHKEPSTLLLWPRRSPAAGFAEGRRQLAQVCNPAPGITLSCPSTKQLCARSASGLPACAGSRAPEKGAPAPPRGTFGI